MYQTSVLDKKTWVYAAGVFDIMHNGHIRYLKRAKELGDILVVGLLTDEGVEKYKPYRPILNYEQRWEIVSAIKYVDHVIKQDLTDPTRTLENLLKEHNWRFDVMVRGDDYKGVPPGSEFIKKHGGTVVRLPYCAEVSSSSIKDKIKRGWNG